MVLGRFRMGCFSLVKIETIIRDIYAVSHTHAFVRGIGTDRWLLHLRLYEMFFSVSVFFNLAKSVHSKNLKISFFVLKRSILTLPDYLSTKTSFVAKQNLNHFEQNRDGYHRLVNVKTSKNTYKRLKMTP